MLKLKKWFYRKYLEFKYRKHDDDICCCGENIGPSWCGSPWPCRSQKEYTITSALDKLEQEQIKK